MSERSHQYRAGIPSIDPEWIQALTRKYILEGKPIDATNVLAFLHSLGYRREEKGSSQEKTEFMLNALLARGLSGKDDWERAGDLIMTVESLGYKKHWHDIRSSCRGHYDYCQTCDYWRGWTCGDTEVK